MTPSPTPHPLQAYGGDDRRPADPELFMFGTDLTLEEKIRRVYRHQIENLPIYARFASELGAPIPERIRPEDIPLLPIRAFREHDLTTEPAAAERHAHLHPGAIRFSSSGTTGSKRSRHIVADPRLYTESVIRGFDRFYGRTTPCKDHRLVPFLPGYADNPESSLVAMIRILADHRGGAPEFDVHPEAFMEAFHAWSRLAGHPPVILFGAAFGLLDLIDAATSTGDALIGLLPEGSIVIETGGMKTHRREMAREELHQRLSSGFGLPRHSIHSEYGMCEMLSQAYSTDGATFTPPPWLIFQIRHPDDPFTTLPAGSEGKLGFIDLANYHSCAFVLTDDHAVVEEDGRIRLLGRWPGAEARGCNFLIDRD